MDAVLVLMLIILLDIPLLIVLSRLIRAQSKQALREVEVVIRETCEGLRRR